MSSEIKQRTVYLIRRSDKFDDGSEFYVGSTSRTLTERLQSHQSNSKVCDSKFYTRMREAGAKNWEIISLETVPLCDKKEILVLEKKWIEKIKPDLNKNFPIKENNERDRERARKHYFKSLEERRYRCDACEKFFGSFENLKKHSYACMNSLD